MGRHSGFTLVVAAGIATLVSLGTTSCGKEEQKAAEKGEKAAPAAKATAPLPPALTSFAAEITVPAPPASAKAKSQISVPAKVRNAGTQAWPAKGGPDGANGVYLAYHWLRPDGSTALFDGKRTVFAADVQPSSEVEVGAAVATPDEPGNYILEFDVLQERIAWFKDRGSKTLRLEMKIE